MKTKPRTPQEKINKAAYNREYRAKVKAGKPVVKKLNLPPEERRRRQLARQSRINAEKKAIRDAERAAGIKPTPIALSEERKAAMRLYAQKKRAAEKALNPGKPKVVRPKPVKAKAVKPKPAKRQIKITEKAPVKSITTMSQLVNRKNTHPKMQQPLKQVIPKAVHKPDHFKQPAKVKITNNSTEGKIKVVIKPGFEVYVRPGQDVEAVRARYLNR